MRCSCSIGSRDDNQLLELALVNIESKDELNVLLTEDAEDGCEPDDIVAAVLRGLRGKLIPHRTTFDPTGSDLIVSRIDPIGRDMIDGEVLMGSCKGWTAGRVEVGCKPEARASWP